MIITVGLGEEASSTILFSIKKQNPVMVLFIYTDESKSNLDSLLPHLQNEPIKIETRKHNEIDDIEKIAMKYSKFIQELKEKSFSSSDIIADYSSGTKPMAAALVYSAIEHNIESISYVYGTRDAKGKVKKKSERIHSISPNAFYTDRKMDQAIHFFNNHQYSSAIEIVDSISSIHPDYEEKVSVFKKYSELYMEWEHFNFENAFTILNTVSKNKLSNDLFKKKLIEEHKTTLYKLQMTKDACEEMVFDLYSNAYRRIQEGKYDDAVARLYRCLEMIGQVAIFQKYDIKNDKFPYSKIPKNLKIHFKSKKNKDNTVKMSLLETFQILKEISHPISKKFFEREGEIKKLLHVRNHSILAHGIKPITQKKAEDLFTILAEVFDLKCTTKFPKIEFSFI